MAKQEKVLIFDFDGTIADSFKIFLQTLNLMTNKKYNVNKSNINELKKLPMPAVIKKLNIHRWQLPFLVLKGRKLLAKKIELVKPFNGIDTTLNTLHKDGYKMYILSSNSASAINTFLQKHNLNEYFINVYGSAGLLSKSKAINKVIKKEGLQKENCIYIGDELRDIEASRKSDIKIISVGWGFSDIDALKEKNQYVATTQQELIKLIKSEK